MLDLPRIPKFPAETISAGSQVSALWPDGVFYPGVVQSVARRDNMGDIMYSVLFQDGYQREFAKGEIVGRTFQNMRDIHLKFNQKVFVKHSGLEVLGFVQKHRKQTNEVFIKLNDKQETLVRRKLQDVSLLPCLNVSSKSQELDIHRMDRSEEVVEPKKRAVATDDFDPTCAKTLKYSKEEEPGMSEVMAAMILTSLHTAQPMECSTAPYSPSSTSPEPSTSPTASSGHFHWDRYSRGTPSPGLSLSDPESISSGPMAVSYPPRATPAESMLGALVFSSSVDEGIDMTDDSCPSVYWDDHSRSPKKLKIQSPSRTLYKCTWQSCTKMLCTVQGIERHIRTVHLGKKENDFSDHEEEFYYTEMEPTMDAFSSTFASMMTSSPPPFDPSHHRSSPHTPTTHAQVFFPAGHITQQCNMNQSISQSLNSTSHYRAIPRTAHIHSKRFEVEVPQRLLQMGQRSPHSVSPPSKVRLQMAGLACSSKIRAEGRKCRKVYGMGHRNLWCTQCKWKKACTRFI